MFKNIVHNQYRDKFNQLLDSTAVLRPKEGWIRTLRKSLSMTGPQLAKRLKVSKSQVSQMERMEIEDRITLKQLRRAAEAMNSTLSYAIIPNKPIHEMIEERAREKAVALVQQADVQMTLEAQQITSEKLEKMIQREVIRLITDLPRDLWED